MSLHDTPTPPVLAARNLTVSRGGRQLFSGLDLEVRAGGALLLRGPNGAGKTSLLLALAGSIRPQSGEVRFGVSGSDGEAAALVHLLLVRNAVQPRLTVGENLDFWRAVNAPTGITTGSALQRVGLGGLDAIEAGHLSTGQARRLALARLLVTRRPIWLLDEPSTGLDVDGEMLVREMIEAHCADGGAVVVATHHDLGLAAGMAVETVTFAAGAAVLSEVPW